jgi:hypothetical protein
METGRFTSSPLKNPTQSNTNIEVQAKSVFAHDAWSTDQADLLKPLLDTSDMFVGARGSATAGYEINGAISKNGVGLQIVGDARAQSVYLQGGSDTSLGTFKGNVASDAYAKSELKFDVLPGGPLGYRVDVGAELGAGAALIAVGTSYESPEIGDPLGIAAIKLKATFGASVGSAEGQVKIGVKTLDSRVGIKPYVGVGVALFGGLRANIEPEISSPLLTKWFGGGSQSE